MKLSVHFLQISLKPFLATLIYLCLNTLAYGQMMMPPAGREFKVNQKFNPSFIAAQEILEIHCIKEIKRDGDRIRKTQEKEVYRFYPDGRLQMHSLINLKRRDTSITFFEYVGERMGCEVKNDAAGMYSYCYVYGENGLPTERKYGRAPRFASITASVSPDRIKEVNTETYKHVRLENQLHSTLFNSAGRPYIKEIRYFDENGYLVSFRQNYVMSSARHFETYEYNEGGWLVKLELDDGARKTQRTYEYDSIGNMLEEGYWVEGKKKHRVEYVYNQDTMRVRAELKREDELSRIVITNYEYVAR